VLVYMWQLLDVFGHRSNVSLVFDYMDTDLEVCLCFTYLSFVYDCGVHSNLITICHESFHNKADKFEHTLLLLLPLCNFAYI